MGLATLTLFPPYSLDTSILVAVLLGVLILAFFTETFGWVFVGLVVPGYLASVLVIHPAAGLTVTVEALLTYLLATALARGLSKTGAWSEFFGRERFFLVVLSSVLVRAVSEAVVLPHVGGWLDARFGTTFVLDRALHSIGLVLVPLTANAFWKLGLRRGALQVGVPVALTWAALQFVLLPYTNLSFSSLELTYEDIAQTFLASPKAYIILLTTAILAARFNLKYGWDFNGILVPALIALTFWTPGKMAATGLEVLVLVFATQALLMLPGISTLNLEGPRKTVLVFALGFLLKWALGWFFGGRVPGLKVTDLFGFGYLIPTLLAVKILQKKAVIRTYLSTAHTAFAGVLVGSLIGFGLSLVEPRPAIAEETPQAEEAPSLGLADSPLGVMAIARATARENGTEARPLPRKRGELRRYSALWDEVGDWLARPTEAHQAKVQRAAAAAGMVLRELPAGEDGRRTFALTERGGVLDKVGWDTALLYPGSPGPVLEVPRPAYEAPAAEASVVLCEEIRCRAIVASGLDTRALSIKQGDAVISDTAPLHLVRQALEAHPRLVLRADGTVPRRGAVLHAHRAIEAWARAWPQAQRSAEPPPEGGLSWSADDVALLRVNPDDLAQRVAEGASLAPAVEVSAAQGLASTPARWRGRALAQPSLEELLVLEHQVASILLEARAPRGRPLEPALRVQWAAKMASLFGLSVRPVRGCGEDCYLVLEADSDSDGGRRVGAGLLVRAGSAPVAFEVPAPDRESGVLELSFEMWRAADARALVFAGPPLREALAGPHPATPGNTRTAFEAFHQAAHRALQGGAVLQLRGYASRAGLEADVVVDLDRPVLEAQGRPEAVTRLFDEGGALRWVSDSVRYFEGAPEEVGFVQISPQQGFSRAYGGAEHATLWLSDKLRGAYVSPRRAEEELGHAGLGQFPLAPLTPQQALGLGELGPVKGRAPDALSRTFDGLMTVAERAVRERNIHDLAQLAREGRAGAVRWEVRTLWSPEHQLPYLWVEARQGRRVMRGVQFVQESEASQPAVQLDLASPDEQALTVALRRRAQLQVAGERAGGRR